MALTDPSAAGWTLPPLALYVHFPWCAAKCPYCDFNSHALHGELPEATYLQALLQDLAHEAPRAQGRVLESIFLGGGTPSLFSAGAMASLIEGVRERLALAPDVEITLEANPGTLERGRFAEYRAAGITRVSLGAQSFSDIQLQRLGRIHRAADTRRAAEELHAAGLANFNLDLMYALPGQTLPQAHADVEAALALAPAHLSHYQLTLEPGTRFAAQPPPDLPDPDVAADMQDACIERLGRAGFARYEVSAYAHGESRCRHNLNYWRFGDYLGIGAGAHGKCTTLRAAAGAAAVCVERTTKWREPRRYLRGWQPGVAREREGDSDGAPAPRAVPVEELPFEYFMNALRLTEGFEQREFETRTGLPFAQVAPRLGSLASRGLLAVDDARWWPTPRGMELLNELLEQFLPTVPLAV